MTKSLEKSEASFCIYDIIAYNHDIFIIAFVRTVHAVYEISIAYKYVFIVFLHVCYIPVSMIRHIA